MNLLSIFYQKPPEAPHDWAYFLDLALKATAIAGGLIAAFRAIREMRQSRVQRERDYRWNQANAAKRFIDEFRRDQMAMNAALMFDLEACEFEVPGKWKILVKPDDVIKGLRIENVDQLTAKDRFIRECVDCLLHYTELIEQSIRNDLFTYEDIAYPIEYVLLTIKTGGFLPAIVDYMKGYFFTNSLMFFKRAAEANGLTFPL